MENATIGWAVLLSCIAAGLLSADSLRAIAEEPPPSPRAPDGVDADVGALIDKAIAARDRAVAAIPRARGSGSYRVTVLDNRMNVVRKERASFQTARSESGEFFQFRYEDGAGYEDPDVYARVVLTDGKTLYECRFCQRIRPTGAEATAIDCVEPGALQPLVWISGNLAGHYSFVQRSLDQKDAEVSTRDEDGVTVVMITDKGHKATQEFWIDPRQDSHIVRYRIMVHTSEGPLTVTDVQKLWKQSNDLWYVERCIVRNKYRQEGVVDRIEETELVFDTFEPNVDIPDDVFSVHALGLPEGSRILWGEKRDRQTEYMRDPQFDLISVERAVGKLPQALPPK
jgi:hypothetical protein